MGPNVNDPKQWDSQPSVTADGKILYFASARDSLTGIDIYSFPVPFSDNLNFRLIVPAAGKGELVLYDLAGRQIKKVIINAIDKGEYFITIPADDIGQGIYMCTLRCGGQTKSIRVTKTK